MCRVLSEEIDAEQRRIEAQRQARKRSLQVAAVCGALLLAGIIWAATHSKSSSPAAPVTPSDEPASDAASISASQPTANPDAQPQSSSAPTTAAAPPTDNSSNANSSSASAPQTADGSSSAVPAPSAPTPENDPQLRNAVSMALRSGQAADWSDGANAGTVSVGEMRPWRGQVCRTYDYTANDVAAGEAGP
jgi:cytoskeletal protein RodZ